MDKGKARRGKINSSGIYLPKLTRNYFGSNELEPRVLLPRARYDIAEDFNRHVPVAIASIIYRGQLDTKSDPDRLPR